MKQLMKNSGITLIALIVTIILLLILAGISIAGLTGNGLFEKAKLAKKAQIEAEMKENLTLAIIELQIEKEGKATLDDITQEWANSSLYEYNPTISDLLEESKKEIKMKKSRVEMIFTVNSNLKLENKQVTNTQEEKEYVYDYLENSYQTFTAEENGLYQIELWGAEGQTNSVAPGKGGYSKGDIYLKKGEQLYIYVGGQNGYNGGGRGYAGETTESTYGGGATDVRLVSGNWNNDVGLNSRIMVAGRRRRRPRHRATRRIWRRYIRWKCRIGCWRNTIIWI